MMGNPDIVHVQVAVVDRALVEGIMDQWDVYIQGVPLGLELVEEDADLIASRVKLGIEKALNGGFAEPGEG